MNDSNLHTAPQPALDEAGLLRDTARGDERAYRTLFDRYQPLLLTFVFRITRDMPATEEIVQDIFLKMWMSRESLIEIKNFRNYLFILSRNNALNFIDKENRQNKKEQTFIKDTGGHVSSAEGTGDPVPDPKRPYHLIDEAIERLPQQQQSAWLLSRHEGLTYDQIAEQMGLSPKTVKRYIRIATDSMKEYIAGRHNNLDLIILLVAAGYL